MTYTSTKHPHVPAAFINTIREEGTKKEACDFLQAQWNETFALSAQLTAALAAVEQARADGHAQGLRDASLAVAEHANVDYPGPAMISSACTAIRAPIPAEPCDTKSAENVTQAGLCQSNAQQATPALAGTTKGGNDE